MNKLFLSNKKLLLSIISTLFLMNINAQYTDSFIDIRDGQTYKTIKIGSQVWMAENLNYFTNNSWCYNNDTSNCVKYGRLYTLEAAKKACPAGWHLPTKDEFDILVKSAGRSAYDAFDYLIERGTSGFSAPFGGYLNKKGKFCRIGKFAHFWSSSYYEGGYYDLFFSKFKSMAYMTFFIGNYGLSVRCIKDN